jgi:hypothetical protein
MRMVLHCLMAPSRRHQLTTATAYVCNKLRETSCHLELQQVAASWNDMHQSALHAEGAMKGLIVALSCNDPEVKKRQGDRLAAFMGGTMSITMSITLPF